MNEILAPEPNSSPDLDVMKPKLVQSMKMRFSGAPNTSSPSNKKLSDTNNQEESGSIYDLPAARGLVRMASSIYNEKVRRQTTTYNSAFGIDNDDSGASRNNNNNKGEKYKFNKGQS